MLFGFIWGTDGRQSRLRASRRRPTALRLNEEALDLSVVGFDPRYAGRHVHQKTVAAQHVLALGQYDAAEHGDQVCPGIENGGFAGYDLILLGHDHAAFGLEALD